jgi:hypothetical protein
MTIFKVLPVDTIATIALYCSRTDILRLMCTSRCLHAMLDVNIVWEVLYSQCVFNTKRPFTDYKKRLAGVIFRTSRATLAASARLLVNDRAQCQAQLIEHNAALVLSRAAAECTFAEFNAALLRSQHSIQGVNECIRNITDHTDRAVSLNKSFEWIQTRTRVRKKEWVDADNAKRHKRNTPTPCIPGV